ncbi:MAG: hypothetical protein U9N59_05545 [Campylobacterota bacterium]|nr:hypothetical protein [Campylobacterota bacterium]
MKITFHIIYMTIEDEVVIENTFGAEPKTIDLDDKNQQLLPIIEKQLLNLCIGKETEYFIISPKDAYGSWTKDALQNIPKNQFLQEIFEDEESLKQLISNGLAAQSPKGEVIPVKIHSINKNDITVDFNHPLVDKELKIKLQVLKRDETNNIDNVMKYLDSFKHASILKFENYIYKIYLNKNYKQKLKTTIIIDDSDRQNISKKELKNSVKEILKDISKEINKTLKENISHKIKVILKSENKNIKNKILYYKGKSNES